MRWTSRSWLWGLVAVLLFGLVLMHHAPSHGGHGPESASAAGSVVAMSDQPVSDCPCPAMAHAASFPSGGGEPDTAALLHLCLAVLAAFGGMLAAGFLLRESSSSGDGNAGSSGLRIGLEYLRPPIPISRRLATLCVFRL